MQADEACDDGVNDGAYGGCDPGCATLAPDCGDGTVDDGESCDDANDVDGDGCNAGCVAGGEVLWAVLIPGTELADLGPAEDGRVRVALQQPPTGSEAHLIVSIDERGVVTEESVIEGLGSSDWVELRSADGFVRTRGNDLESYDDDGLALWSLEYPSASSTIAPRLGTALAGGGAALTRSSFEPTVVIGVDASGGLAWEVPETRRIVDIVSEPGGGVLTLGQSEAGAGFVVVRYGVGGEVEFETSVPATFGYGSIAITEGGVGVCWAGGPESTYGVAKLSFDGGLEWSGSYGLAGVSVAECIDVTVLKGGDVVIFEESGNGLSFDSMPLLRRVSGAEPVWERLLDEGGGVMAARVTEDAGDKLAVAYTRVYETHILRVEP